MSTMINEIAISKAVSVKLDDHTIAIIAHVYHTADRKNNPDDVSWYKYAGRVIDVLDLEAEIAEDRSHEKRLDDWKWDSPAWDSKYIFGYDGGNNRAKAARWKAMKIKKAMSWDSYLKLVKDGIKTLSTGKTKQSSSSKYETAGYIDAEGHIYDITDKDILLSLKGRFFWKECPLKRDLKKTSKK